LGGYFGKDKWFAGEYATRHKAIITYSKQKNKLTTKRENEAFSYGLIPFGLSKSAFEVSFLQLQF
jgi:hypothetical protein